MRRAGMFLLLLCGLALPARGQEPARSATTKSAKPAKTSRAKNEKTKPPRELKVEQPTGDIFAEQPKDSALPNADYESPLQIQPSAPVPSAPPAEDVPVLPFNADDLPSGE